MGRDVDFDHRARRGLSRSFQLSVNMPLGMWGVHTCICIVHAQYRYRINVISIIIQIARESVVRCGTVANSDSYDTNYRAHDTGQRVLQLRNKNSNKWVLLIAKIYFKHLVTLYMYG